MPIPLTCDCGRSFRIKDELAGAKIKCPSCAAVLQVPRLEAERDPEDEALDFLLADSPREAESRQSGIRSAPPPPAPEPAVRPSLPPSPPPPARRPAPSRVARHEEPKRGPRIAFEGGWFGSLNAGVIGGLLMMLIAIVWFVAGLAAGIIFIYPPILLVIGLVALGKGLMGRE